MLGGFRNIYTEFNKHGASYSGYRLAILVQFCWESQSLGPCSKGYSHSLLLGLVAYTSQAALTCHSSRHSTTGYYHNAEAICFRVHSQWELHGTHSLSWPSPQSSQVAESFVTTAALNSFSIGPACLTGNNVQTAQLSHSTTTSGGKPLCFMPV